MLSLGIAFDILTAVALPLLPNRKKQRQYFRLS